MKRFKYIGFTLAAFLGFISCQQKDLFLHETNGNNPVNVVIHWDSVPTDQLVLPSKMTVHWYPETGSIFLPRWVLTVDANGCTGLITM